MPDNKFSNYAMPDLIDYLNYTEYDIFQLCQIFVKYLDIMPDLRLFILLCQIYVYLFYYARFTSIYSIMPDLRLFILLCQIYVYLFYYARFTSIYSILLELSQIFNYSFDYARFSSTMLDIMPVWHHCYPVLPDWRLSIISRIMPDFHQLC